MTRVRTITTKSGRNLYVVTTIPQSDGEVRLICVRSMKEYREARAVLDEDPAMVDYHPGLIPVDGRAEWWRHHR